MESTQRLDTTSLTDPPSARARPVRGFQSAGMSGSVVEVKIGEFGHRAGVSSKTIRYYESIGLLDEPIRTPAGYRDYDEGAVERLQFIRSAQATGLSLAEIASVLELKEAGQRSCAHTTALLERHLVELDAQIARLRKARAGLQELADRARDLDPTTCTDRNRCQVIATFGDAIPVSTDSP